MKSIGFQCVNLLRFSEATFCQEYTNHMDMWCGSWQTSTFGAQQAQTEIPALPFISHVISNCIYPVGTSVSSSTKCACMLGCFSHVWVFETLWTIAHQSLLSMGFCRQENWSGLLCPPPGDLSNPGIKPLSLMSPALAGGFFTTRTTWEVHKCSYTVQILKSV